MKRNILTKSIGTSACLFIILISTFYISPAQALPIFARQTQNACNMCHFQHFPKLKQFGRIFKANGLSLTTQTTIEDDNLSIPAALNATFFTRSKYTQTSDASVDRGGNLALPQEGSIFVGGRLGDGIGGIVEWGGPLLGTKLIFSQPMGAGSRMGATLFTTDALGPAYGFEIMNTGVVRNHNPFEQSSNILLGNVDNLELAQAATGVTIFGFKPGTGFITAALYAPDSNEAGLTNMDVNSDLSHYLRAAYMPQLENWELGLGIGLHGGTTRATVADGDFAARCQITAGETCAIHTSAMFVDFQAQGLLLNRETGLYFIYAQGDEPTSNSGQINLFAGDLGNSKPKGWGLDGEYSMTSRLHLIGTASNTDNGSHGNKKTAGVGLYYSIAQNISVQPMYEIIRGTQGVDIDGDSVNRVSLTLEADF